MPIETINDRQYVPLRLIPFLTEMVLSANTVMEILANRPPWQQLALPSFKLLADGSFSQIASQEWETYIAGMERLQRKQMAGYNIQDNAYEQWHSQSIKIFSPATFVWLDDLIRAFAQAQHDGNVCDRHSGNRELSLPLHLPPHLREIIYEGFNCPMTTAKSLQSNITQPDFNQQASYQPVIYQPDSSQLIISQLAMMQSAPPERIILQSINAQPVVYQAVNIQSEIAPAADKHPENDDPYGWKKLAWEIGKRIYQKYPHLSLEQIALKVHKELKNRNIYGRGGRVPSPASIKRHALKGLKR